MVFARDLRLEMIAALYVCSTAGAQLKFSERASDAGCSVVHQTALQLPDMEFMAPGGAVGDFNRDGYLDLFVIGGGGGMDRLFLNNGNGTFTDVTLSAGVGRTHRGTGVAVGDYNNDGWLDIYVTSIGTTQMQSAGRNILWRNNGNGTFTDVAQAAGVRMTHQSLGEAFGAAFGDFDGDGDLDLAVAGWQGGNRLFRNNGNGTFTNVTSIALPAGMNTVKGYAPRFVDMNGDGWPDLLWVADFLTSRYLINNGDGTFTDATGSSGTGLDSNGMGNTFGDFDNDGRFDWYVTSRINEDKSAGSGNMLYRQVSPHVFEEISVAAGVNFGYWGWGTEATDFDHDGRVDIVATNGWEAPNQADPTQLYMNNGDGTFTDRAVETGILHAGQGRGLLTADFDNKGSRDIVIFNTRQPMLMYRNDLPNPGATSITLRFVTKHVAGLAPDGFGTKVVMQTPGLTQMRYIDGGSTYLAQSELSAHFGLAGATHADLTITYANGMTELLKNVPAGIYTITAKACVADFQPDGVLNFFDVSTYLAAFSARHPQADLNDDGVFNFFDVAGYLGAFSAGCP